MISYETIGKCVSPPEVFFSDLSAYETCGSFVHMPGMHAGASQGAFVDMQENIASDISCIKNRETAKFTPTLQFPYTSISVPEITDVL